MNNVSQACNDLLPEARRFGPLYADRLANHLPMALVALDRLGADATTMQAFLAHYSRRLKPAPAQAEPLDPRGLLGTLDRYPAFAAYFREQVAAIGWQAVLREWLPLLLPGVGASAFHALIRLAYAIEAGDETAIAPALASWAAEYLPMPLSMQPADGTPEEIAAVLARAVEGYAFAPGNISDRMAQIARHPALAGAAVQPRELTLNDLAAFGIAAYWAHEDFTLLHLVTGCHAFRLVLPYAGDEPLALRYLWQAVLAARLTVKPEQAATDHGEPGARDVTDIATLARTSRDDHVIKLCYSALCEYRQYGDDRYLRAAWRKAATDRQRK
jgi:hypothetical protein